MLKYLVAFLFLISSANAAEPFKVLSASVVKVLSGRGMGSGAVIQAPGSGKKYIMTNWHVCHLSKPGTTYYSMLEDGTYLHGKAAYMDIHYDLCLIEVDQRQPAIIIGVDIEFREKLFTQGFPRGKFRESEGRLDRVEMWELDMQEELSGDACPKDFTKVHTLFRQRCMGTYPTGITTLYGAPGSSGSAVVNESGQLVAVIQSAESDGGDSAGVILIDRVREFLVGK